MVVLRSATEFATLREAGRIVAETLAAVVAVAKAGMRLRDLDELAAESIAQAGAKPSFLGYHPEWAPVPYPGVLCLSVNEAVVHGIPDDRVLADGDLLSVDCGAYIDGYHGDAAVTVGIGEIDAEAARLKDTSARALAAGIAAARPGAKMGDISYAVQSTARAGGYGLPRGLGRPRGGHRGHEDPHVPNTGQPGRGLTLQPGLVIAIEPMLIEGGRDNARTLGDGWTIVHRRRQPGRPQRAHDRGDRRTGPVILTAP